MDHRRAEPSRASPAAVRPATHATAIGRLPFELASPDRFRRTLGALRREVSQAPAEAAIFDETGPPSFSDGARAAAWEGPLSPFALLGEIEQPPLDANPDARDESPSDGTDDSRDDSSGESPVPEPAPMRAEPAPAPAPGFAALHGGAGPQGDERKPSATTAVDGPAAVDAADGLPAWLVETAQQIEWLCARADPAFQTWAVTVPMDPITLPDTELALSLSHFSITLRFRTRSEHSARLVSRHRGQLQALLEKLPSLPQSIDIDLE